MDIQDLMGKMLSGDTLKGLGQLTGSSQKDVKGVLTAALPAMLEGARGQATDAKTAEGFVGALADHARDDTRDLSSFISGVDLADGGKILGHLLGNKTAVTESAAQSAGVEPTKAGSILAGAAPLLMSLLGQQTASGENASGNNASGIGGLMGSLLGSVDLGSLLGGLLGGSDDSAASASTTGKKKKKKKTSSNNSGGGGLLNSILGLFKG